MIEQDDGTWACRHGRTHFDVHDRLALAVAHIVELAKGSEPARIFLHRLDGEVVELAES
ncbi:hypothetical protein [Nakamurella panacisegetis]|uniref:hypothetical protein n=1 Tax=Nakamurella panacisegetis TaxID=1090615 RepID=UPI0012FD855C|nr:hypothetical protein [Nakamurella panacisegetis]